MDLDFTVGSAVGAGILATLAMTAVMYMGKFMLPRQMPMDILYMLGTMMTRDKPVAYGMGSMMHAAAGIGFALIHIALFVAFDIDDDLVLWGILFGAVHWMIMGMMMGMMKVMHPRIQDGTVPDPGFFLKNFPPMNIMGFLMVHLLYGLTLGALYEAFE